MINPNRQYIIGTAGHIDHGKTSLVKAITGVDTDHLPEEKSRGITIDIGFAHLGDNITFIDVPGHERLIKNMVAGVSTIDMVLFVIAADDGVMPQSREHLDIIKLLQIRHGIFAITKCDLAEPDWLKLVEEDIRLLTAGSAFATSPIYRVSSTTGDGIEALNTALMKELEKIQPRGDNEIYRQPIDRVFSLHGFGTVGTGTVLSGEVASGDEVEIQPSGRRVRVRGLQSHDQNIKRAKSGYRAAVNLAGVEIDGLQRGMVLCRPETYQAARIVNVRLSVLKNSPAAIKNNQRVRLHLHTIEAFGRVILPHRPQLVAGEDDLAQLRLEQPIHAAVDDRFIIRQYSPQRTIGGGVILQVNPEKFRRRIVTVFDETLALLESDRPLERLLGAFDPLTCRPMKLWDLKASTNLPIDQLQKLLRAAGQEQKIFSESISGKAHYFSDRQLSMILEHITPFLQDYHDKYPGRPGLQDVELISQFEKRFPVEAIRKAIGFGEKTGRLVCEHLAYRLAEFTPQLAAADSISYQQLITIYREARYCPPTLKDAQAMIAAGPKEFKEMIKLMRQSGELLSVDEGLLFFTTTIEELKDILRNFFTNNDELSVAAFKELTSTTRKHAIPLLTYLDRHEFTSRENDIRRIGPRLRG